VSNPSRVDENAVMSSELGVGPVDLGVVDVGLDHPGPEVVELLWPIALCGRRPEQATTTG
jgi:hypothetical protein